MKKKKNGLEKWEKKLQRTPETTSPHHTMISASSIPAELITIHMYPEFQFGSLDFKYTEDIVYYSIISLYYSYLFDTCYQTSVSLSSFTICVNSCYL